MQRTLSTAMLLLSATLFSQTSQAQWVHSSNIDAFTDKTTIITKNTGRILDGEKGATSLIHRTNDGVSELFWNTPDGFLCDVTVMGRIDGAEPFPVGVNLSTDRTSVFFSDTRSLMEAMIGSRTTRLRLTDSCGGYIVAEFSGNTDSYLPQYAMEKKQRETEQASALKSQRIQDEQAAIKQAGKASQLSTYGWTVINAGVGQSNGWQKEQNNNFIQLKSENASLTYRKSQTPVGPPFALRSARTKTYHDLSFGVFDPELATPVESMSEKLKLMSEFSKKVKVKVGKKSFKAHSILQYADSEVGKLPNALTGAVAVYVAEPRYVEALYEELTKPETDSVTVQLKGKEYTIPTSNFLKAVEYYY